MWVVLRPIPPKREGDAQGSLFLVKSPETGNKAQRKIKYKNYHAQLWGENISGNYYRKLWVEIISGNNYRKLIASILSREKCEIYRDTGVSKNWNLQIHILLKHSRSNNTIFLTQIFCFSSTETWSVSTTVIALYIA